MSLATVIPDYSHVHILANGEIDFLENASFSIHYGKQLLSMIFIMLNFIFMMLIIFQERQHLIMLI